MSHMINDNEEMNYICDDCGEHCYIAEETFDYPGTHCTGGMSGTHRTGNFSTECCNADYTEAE